MLKVLVAREQVNKGCWGTMGAGSLAQPASLAQKKPALWGESSYFCLQYSNVNSEKG